MNKEDAKEHRSKRRDLAHLLFGLDAALMFGRFARRARDEVELEALTAELVRVVQETMQPERVSLWLAGEQRGKNV